ncbi:MAG: hypothetical protein WCG20_03315 [bacterium]
MQRTKKISRIVIIDDTYKFTKDAVTTALDKLKQPTGVVVCDTKSVRAQTISQVLRSAGFMPATESEHFTDQLRKKNALEQVAHFIKYYQVVFLIYPHNSVDLCYQDAVDLSQDVITIH